MSVIAINSAGASPPYSMNHTVQVRTKLLSFQWRISIDMCITFFQEWQPLGEETDVILLFDDDEDSVIALGDPIRMIPIIGKITMKM